MHRPSDRVFSREPGKATGCELRRQDQAPALCTAVLIISPGFLARVFADNLQAQFQPIVRNAYALRKTRFCGLRKIVADVRKVSRFRLYARCRIQGLPNAQVCRMRSIAKRVDDKDFHARDKIDNRIRYRAAIA